MSAGQALFLALGGAATAALFAELAARFPDAPQSRAACGGIAAGLLLAAFGLLLVAQADRARAAVAAVARPPVQAASRDAL